MAWSYRAFPDDADVRRETAGETSRMVADENTSGTMVAPTRDAFVRALDRRRALRRRRSFRRAKEGRRSGWPARLGGLHPAVVFVVVMLAGLAAIAALSIGLGFLVTRVLEHAWGIGAAERALQRVARRAPDAGSARMPRWLGSIVAGGVVLPIVVGSIALVCAVLRKWRIAAFVVFALAVESATYRATTLVVHSHRPRVARLENLPVNASYPSGHTAASIAVYGGLVLLLTSELHQSRVPGVRLDVRPGDGRVRRPGADVSRHAPPAGRRRRRRRGHRCRDRPRLRVPDRRCRGRGCENDAQASAGGRE